MSLFLEEGSKKVKSFEDGSNHSEKARRIKSLEEGHSNAKKQRRFKAKFIRGRQNKVKIGSKSWGERLRRRSKLNNAKNIQRRPTAKSIKQGQKH